MGDAKDRNDGLWIEHSDRLFVAAYSSVASLVVRFSGYFRKTDGDIIEYAVDVEPTSDRAVTSKDFFFGAGFMLSCTASLSTGNANRGQCYIRAHIQRNTGTAAVKLQTILAGYVTDNYTPSFPFGKMEDSLEGRGMLRSITGTDPAAGAEVTESVPTGARWKIHSIKLLLVTDGNAANREIKLRVDDGTTIFASSGSAGAHAASTTKQYFFAAYSTEDTTNSLAICNVWPFFLPLLAGWRFLTATDNIQVGDNYAAPQYLIEEWLEA